MENEPTSSGSARARLGMWDVISIIAGIIIGAGIYKVPAFIFQQAASAELSLALWVAAGLLVFVGALCYAELATTYPRSGGDYNYHTRAYGSLPGYLFGWTQLAVIQTGSIGLMAFVFGDYAKRLFGAGYFQAVWPGGGADEWHSMIVDYSVIFAAGAIVVITFINMLGVALGKTIQNLLTLAKVLGLLLIVVAGFAFARSSVVIDSPAIWGQVVSTTENQIVIKSADGEKKFDTTKDTRIVINNSLTFEDKKTGDKHIHKLTTIKKDASVKVVANAESPNAATWIRVQDVPGLSGIAFALVLVFLAYGGWNDAAFVAAEVRNRQRNIPWALLLGAVLVMVIYVAVNAAYIAGLGFEEASLSPEIAADVLALLPGELGQYGEQVMCILVMISALGAVNGLIYTSSRIYATLGEDYSLFALLGKWNESAGVPLWSLITQMAISLVMVLAVGTSIGQNLLNEGFAALRLETVNWAGEAGFNSLLRCTAPVFWAFFLMTAVSVIVLRIKDIHLPRPFAVPLFPFIPLIFVATCGYMLYSGVNYAQQLGLVGGALVLAGLPFYFLSKKNIKHVTAKSVDL